MFPDVVALFKADIEAEYKKFKTESSRWQIVKIPNRFDTLGNPDCVARCPVCAFQWGNVQSALTYFRHCPHCGAKMDGGRDEKE